MTDQQLPAQPLSGLSAFPGLPVLPALTLPGLPAYQGLPVILGSLNIATLPPVKEVPKLLWEYDTKECLEIEYNHLCEVKGQPGRWSSWKVFTEAGPFNCNCTFQAPLLHWWWTSPEESEDEEEKPEAKELAVHKVNLVFLTFHHEISRFEVVVTKDDEPAIRTFIREHRSACMLV